MTDEVSSIMDYVMKDTVPGISTIKPNYNITFCNEGKQLGVIDWNGPEMTFTGDVDESAKIFFDWIAAAFKGRLEQERAEEREACAKVAEASDRNIAAAIRARVTYGTGKYFTFS